MFCERIREFSLGTAAEKVGVSWASVCSDGVIAVVPGSETNGPNTTAPTLPSIPSASAIAGASGASGTHTGSGTDAAVSMATGSSAACSLWAAWGLLEPRPVRLARVPGLGPLPQAVAVVEPCHSLSTGLELLVAVGTTVWQVGLSCALSACAACCARCEHLTSAFSGHAKTQAFWGMYAETMHGDYAWEKCMFKCHHQGDHGLKVKFHWRCMIVSLSSMHAGGRSYRDRHHPSRPCFVHRLPISPSCHTPPGGVTRWAVPGSIHTRMRTARCGCACSKSGQGSICCC